MLYQDTVEILEALGIDPICGEQEWVGRFHRQDLMALAEALLWCQVGTVSYLKNVKGDPFGKDLEAFAKELLIEPRTRGTNKKVSPSFYTYKPSRYYILDKICDFFNRVLPEVYEFQRFDHVFWKKNEMAYTYEVWINAREKNQQSSGYGTEREDEYLLLSFPTHLAFTNHAQVKADLLRFLFDTAHTGMESLYVHPNQPRFMSFQIVSYVDALWGMTIVHE